MPAPMTEFEGAPFQIVHEGEWLPMWEPTSNYNVIPIPGSNSSVTFLMGTGVLTATWTVECDDQSDYALLAALLQSEGTLRMPSVVAEDMGAEVDLFGAIYTEIPDVTLLELKSPQIALNGCVQVTCTFSREGRDE